MSQEIIRSDKSKYIFNKKDLLGRGAYGSVYQGLDQTTKLPVAIKVMGDVKFKKSEEKYVKSAKREVKIFRRVVDLPNVIKMIDYIEDEFDIYIVMEFCEGGTLRQLLRSQKGKRFEEADVVKHLKEIATGVFGLHQKNIMHKDLNLENVLLKENKCILADLGSAMRRRTSRNFAGAVGYTAPEVHLVNQGKSYNKQVDIWSMGVIFFEMLYTRAVYKDMQKQIIEEASMGAGRFPKEPKVSKNAKDLLNKMLTVDPNQRITIEGIVNHPLLRPEGAPVIKYKEEELREEDEDEEELAEAEQDTRTEEEIAQRKTEKNQKKKLKKKLRKQAKAAQLKEGEDEEPKEEDKESEDDDKEEKIEEKKLEKQEKPEIKEEVKYDEINDDGFTTVTTKSKKKKRGK